MLGFDHDRTVDPVLDASVQAKLAEVKDRSVEFGVEQDLFL